MITNIKADRMSACEIISAYKHLWIVEDAFGEIKGMLKTRPIYHWSDDRIKGHLAICFLTYFCEAQMTKLLRKNEMMLESKAIEEQLIDKRALTVAEAMQELIEVRAIPVKLKDNLVWIRNDIKGNAAKLLKAIGAPISSKAIKSYLVTSQFLRNVVAHRILFFITYS